MKTPKPPTLRWKRVPHNGTLFCGDVEHVARSPRPYDLHFSVWISPPEPGVKHWVIDLAAWVGPEEEPTFQTTSRLPAKLTLAQIEERVPVWQLATVCGAFETLMKRAAFINSLIHL